MPGLVVMVMEPVTQVRVSDKGQPYTDWGIAQVPAGQDVKAENKEKVHM